MVTAAVVTAVVMPVLVAVMPVLVVVISVAADGVTAADGTEGAVTGEDTAITHTDGTAIPTIVTVAGIGQLSVILTARATESGFHTIEGGGELRTCVRLTRPGIATILPACSLSIGLSSYRYKERVLLRVSRGSSHR